MKQIDLERKNKLGEEDPAYANGTLQKVFADALNNYIGKPTKGGRAVSFLRDMYEKKRSGMGMKASEEAKANMY